MKLRNHTDHDRSVQRTTAALDIQPPLTDEEVGAMDTKPLWRTGTPLADAHEARLAALGLAAYTAAAMTDDDETAKADENGDSDE